MWQAGRQKGGDRLLKGKVSREESLCANSACGADPIWPGRKSGGGRVPAIRRRQSFKGYAPICVGDFSLPLRTLVQCPVGCLR